MREPALPGGCTWVAKRRSSPRPIGVSQGVGYDVPKGVLHRVATRRPQARRQTSSPGLTRYGMQTSTEPRSGALWRLACATEKAICGTSTRRSNTAPWAAGGVPAATPSDIRLARGKRRATHPRTVKRGAPLGRPSSTLRSAPGRHDSALTERCNRRPTGRSSGDQPWAPVSRPQERPDPLRCDTPAHFPSSWQAARKGSVAHSAVPAKPTPSLAQWRAAWQFAICSGCRIDSRTRRRREEQTTLPHRSPNEHRRGAVGRAARRCPAPTRYPLGARTGCARLPAQGVSPSSLRWLSLTTGPRQRRGLARYPRRVLGTASLLPIRGANPAAMPAAQHTPSRDSVGLHPSSPRSSET